MPVAQAEEAMQPLEVGEQPVNMDTVSDSPSNLQVATACTDSEKPRRDLSDLLSQIAELEMRCDAQSEELDYAEKELRDSESLVEERDRTIATLTAQVDHEKCAHATQEEQVAAERRDNEKLRRDIAPLSFHITDLERRYDAQEEAIRKELRTMLAHPINFLVTTFMQAQSEDRTKAEQFSAARWDLCHLSLGFRPRPACSCEVRKMTLDVAQSRELDSELWERTWPRQRASRLPWRYAARRFSPECLDSEESKTLPYPRTLADAASKIAELQMRYHAQSKQLDSVWNKVAANYSLVEEGDRTISTLTYEVDWWKRAVATMAKYLAAVRRVKEQPLLDLAALSPRIASLRQYYDGKSKAIHDKLQTHMSLLEHVITFLTTAFTQAQSEEIATARSNLD